MKRIDNQQKAFTLVELMIVVAIISTLVAIAIPIVNRFIDNSKHSEADENLRSMADHAVAYYHKDHYFGVNGTNKQEGVYPGCQDGDNMAAVACDATSNTCTGITLNVGQLINANDVSWNEQPWTRLNFAINKAMHYCYAYTTNNSVTTFEAVATGSLSAANDSQFKISGDAKGQVTSVIQIK